MKKVLRFSLMLLATLFASVNIMAQTDVTSEYIKNADFDVESDWVAEGNVALNPASKGNVAEWTCTSSESWNGSAVLKIGSTATMNNATVPALNAAGAAEGGAFACAASWGNKVQYTQEITLPAGSYVLSFDAYEGNSSAQTSGLNKNLIGFIAADGTEYLAKTEIYTVGEWTNHEIKFTLFEETTGKMSIGYESMNVTSNNTPKLFIDNIKLTQGDIEYPVDLSGRAINRHNGWTKLASAGSINNFQTDYAEFYNAQHVTGDIMQQVVNVPNGKYNVEVRFNANCANWECTPVEAAEGQNGYTVMDINGTTVNTPVRNSKGLTSEQPYLYSLNDIEVTDGNLTFKVTNLKEAANWITVSISKIELQKPEEPAAIITGASFLYNEEEIALSKESAVSVEGADAIKVGFGDNYNVVKYATYIINELVDSEENQIATGQLNLNGFGYAQLDPALLFNDGSKYNMTIKAWDTEDIYTEDLNIKDPIATLTCEFNGTHEEGGWDGKTVLTSMDNGVVTKIDDLNGLVITLPGAKSIEVLAECSGLMLQNEDGSEMYGVWSPDYGSTCTIEGETITLDGFLTPEGTSAIPAGTTKLYIEDYESFKVDGKTGIYLPTIELTANIAGAAEPFAIAISNNGVAGDATKAVEAAESGVMYQFEVLATGKSLRKGEGVPTLQLVEDPETDFGAAQLVAYEAETAYVRFMTLQTPYFTAPGTYLLTIPEGTFVDADGTPNAATTMQWVIIQGNEAGTFAITGAANGGNAPETEVEALSYMFELTAANAITALHEGNITLTDAENQPVGDNAYVFGYEGEGGATTVYARFTFDTEDHNLHTAGTYTLNVPAGMFKDAEGNLSEAYTATWTIKGQSSATDFSADFTTNVEFVAGEKSYLTDSIYIDGVEYGAYKIGTSKAGGSCSVKLPAGTTHFAFHAIGWSKSDNTPLHVEGAGINADVVAGTGNISGNSPYTFDTENYDPKAPYFSYEFAALTEETEVTFSADYRVVFYGVHAEGAKSNTFAITGATNGGNAPESEVEAISYTFELTAANAITGLHEGNITLTDAENQPVGGNAYVFGYEGEGGSATVYARFTFDTEDHNLHTAGTYTLNVPAGMFTDAEGNLSEAYTANWTIKEQPEAGTFAITGAANGGNAPESEVEAISYMFELTAANAITGLHEGNITLTDAENQPVGGNAYVFGYEGEAGSATVYARFTFDTEDHQLHTAGTYTLNVPAGMFIDAEGNLSEAYTAAWTIKESETKTIVIETVEVDTIVDNSWGTNDVKYTVTVKFKKPEGAKYAYTEGLHMELNGENTGVPFTTGMYGMVTLEEGDDVTIVFTDPMFAATDDETYEGDIRPAGSYVGTTEITFMDENQWEIEGVTATFTGSIVLPNLNAVELGEEFIFNVDQDPFNGLITLGELEANGLKMTMPEAKNITPDMTIKVVADFKTVPPSMGGAGDTPQDMEVVLEDVEAYGDAMFGVPTVMFTDFAQYISEAGAGAYAVVVKSIEVISQTGVEASWTAPAENPELVSVAFEVTEPLVLEATAEVGMTEPNQYGDQNYTITLTVAAEDFAGLGITKAFCPDGVQVTRYLEDEPWVENINFASVDQEGVEVTEENDIVMVCKDAMVAMTTDPSYEGEIRAEGQDLEAMAVIYLLDENEDIVCTAEFRGLITLDKTVGVQRVNVNLSLKNIYNIAGQKLNKTQKGINIINGKKVLVK